MKQAKGPASNKNHIISDDWLKFFQLTLAIRFTKKLPAHACREAPTAIRAAIRKALEFRSPLSNATHILIPADPSQTPGSKRMPANSTATKLMPAAGKIAVAWPGGIASLSPTMPSRE